MGNSLRLLLCVAMLAWGLPACSSDGDTSGDGGSAGGGAAGGSAGGGGDGGSAGVGGLGGSAGIGGNGGFGGSTELCVNDGTCDEDDACVCADCDDDFFCGDPDNCADNGMCFPLTEGCVCTDCAAHPECLN